MHKYTLSNMELQVEVYMKIYSRNTVIIPSQLKFLRDKSNGVLWYWNKEFPSATSDWKSTRHDDRLDRNMRRLKSINK
jgi:hypothetical protein